MKLQRFFLICDVSKRSINLWYLIVNFEDIICVFIWKKHSFIEENKEDL